MEGEPSGGEEREPAVGWGGVGDVKDGAIEGFEQKDEREEEKEGVGVEPEREIAVAEGVVEGERGGDDGAVGAVGWEDAEGGGVGEERGDVVEAADGGVVDDGVEVVEVEAVVEGVGVGEGDGEQEKYAQGPGCGAGGEGTEGGWGRTRFQAGPRAWWGLQSNDNATWSAGGCAGVGSR